MDDDHRINYKRIAKKIEDDVYVRIDETVHFIICNGGNLERILKKKKKIDNKKQIFSITTKIQIFILIYRDCIVII